VQRQFGACRTAWSGDRSTAGCPPHPWRCRLRLPCAPRIPRCSVWCSFTVVMRETLGLWAHSSVRSPWILARTHQSPSVTVGAMLLITDAPIAPNTREVLDAGVHRHAGGFARKSMRSPGPPAAKRSCSMRRTRSTSPGAAPLRLVENGSPCGEAGPDVSTPSSRRAGAAHRGCSRRSGPVSASDLQHRMVASVYSTVSGT